MFKNLKQLFTSKNKDLRHRIYFTLGALLIFAVGTTIELPTVKDSTKALGFFELLNVIGGGALERASIFALGVSPYITASILIQLLQMDIIPYFSELGKQGHTGRQKLNQITRYIGIIFAAIQGFAMSYYFLGAKSPLTDRIITTVVLTAGTAFLLWLGDQITQKGIGNGISLIIMAGIVNTLPSMFATAFKELTGIESGITAIGIGLFVLFVIVYILVIVGTIFVEGAERKIPIQYANKSTSSLGKQTYMPIKLNSAGVMPVIFASSLLGVPATIAQFINKQGFTDFVNTYLNYTKPVGFIIFVLLILFFAYFYTFIQMKPDDMAKNLQNNGGYIPGVKPGESTSKYLSKVLSRLTIVGAIFLTIIAALPVIISITTSLPSSVSIGGTGLLIVVGVSIETYKQLESSLLSRSYSGNKSYRRARA